MKLAVAGHLVMDRIISVDRLPEPDTSVAVKSMTDSFGGTAGNLSIMATQLGLKTGILSFVGDDFPEGYRKELENHNISTDAIIEIKGEKTPTSILISDRNERQAGLFYQGAMEKMADREIPQRMIDEAGNSDILHIGTGHPEFYKRLVDRAGEKKEIIIGFEPGQEIHYIYDENSLWDMLKRTSIYFTNENEWNRTRDLLGIEREEELLALVRVYVKTLGSRGSIIYTEDRNIEIPAIPPEKEVDSTGCGDAYKGAFYAALYAKGMELEEAGRAGAAAASYILERKGTQVQGISWEMIERRMWV